jgi:dolichol kinase
MNALKHELMGVIALSAFFLCLILAAELWCRLRGAKPEWTRKLVHVGGGMACLAIPWLVQSAWTVFAMAAALSLLFAVGGKTRRLRALHGVDRKTRGSEYYPLSIFLLYVMTRGQAWLYVSSVLVLAVADGFAALIGTRYGSVKYQVEEDQKSLEGSLAFMAIAFVAMLLPLRLMTDLPVEICALSALLVAVLVTGFEAISLYGSDNIFVPLGVCVILAKITTKPVGEIVYQACSLAGLSVFVSVLAFRTHSFNMGGAIAFCLFTYGAWALGSALWALPVLAGFLAYMLAWLLMPLPTKGQPLLKVRIVFRAILVPLDILVLGNMLAMPAFFYGPFMATLAVVLALTLWNHRMRAHPVRPERRPAAALGTGLLACTITVLPPLLMEHVPPVPMLIALGLLTPVAVCLADRFMGAKPLFDDENTWDWKRMALTAASAVLVMLLQGYGLLPHWAVR